MPSPSTSKRVHESARGESASRSDIVKHDANAALATCNVSEPRYPLAASMEAPRFKLFCADVGLLTCLSGMDVVRNLLADRPDINYGALYENAAAQELTAHGRPLFYFKKRNIGELDFLLQNSGQRVVPLEVKSGKGYTRHSALNHALNTPDYGIEEAIVLCNANVKVDGPVSYLPVYMAMFL